MYPLKQTELSSVSLMICTVDYHGCFHYELPWEKKNFLWGGGGSLSRRTGDTKKLSNFKKGYENFLCLIDHVIVHIKDIQIRQICKSTKNI